MADGYDFVDPVLNVFVGDDDEWIIWSPQGYYDASPGADRLIGWHVNRGPTKSAKYFEAQQFREQLYRPDIIDRILDGDDVEDAVRIANESRTRDTNAVDFRMTREIAEHHPPEIEITNPRGSFETASDRVAFTAHVESPNGFPVKEVTLLHNGNVRASLSSDHRKRRPA